MKTKNLLIYLFVCGVFTTSCVSKKEFSAVQSELDLVKSDLESANADLAKQVKKADNCMQEKSKMEAQLNAAQSNLDLRQEQINDLRNQISDIKTQRDKQLSTVDDLTTLSQSATENIERTLTKLEEKDRYISLLQAAKNRADSVNLALSVNLKSQLADGIADEDIQISVDKTVVMVNLSDKMLYRSGSSRLNSSAKNVLGKIAKIIQSRPNLEVMIEGNTDDVPIKTACLQDNWDLSVMRATSVARALQDDHGVAPSRIIAAGRGEYSPIASNEEAEGRSKNRRTRIIIMPKLDEFYDLLNPDNVPE